MTDRSDARRAPYWVRLALAAHILLVLRWYVDALIRVSEGRFWVTNKLWLTYAYASNPQAWEELVWSVASAPIPPSPWRVRCPRCGCIYVGECPCRVASGEEER